MPAKLPDLLDEPAARAARLVALRLLDDAAAEHARLTKRTHETLDPEALHDFRVAVRRLRSWLRAWRGTLRGSVPKKAERRLRAIARATNASRDAEVHLEWLRAQGGGLSARHRLGLEWLVERTLDRQRAGDEELTAELRDDFARAWRRLAEALSVYMTTVRVADEERPPTFAAAAAALVDAHVAELGARLDAVRTKDDQAAAHEARIAAKRLRYLLEPVAPHVPGGEAVVDELKSLQDVLGDMHDVHLFSAEIVEAAEAAPARSRRNALRPGLVALARLLGERGDAAWAEVERAWLGGGAAPLLERAGAVARRLERRAAAGLEAERSFLIACLPDQVGRESAPRRGVRPRRAEATGSDTPAAPSSGR